MVGGWLGGEEMMIVYGVDFDIGCGEVFVLIGELGFGKMMIVLLLMGYVCVGCWIVGGLVKFDGFDVCMFFVVEVIVLCGCKVVYIV